MHEIFLTVACKYDGSRLTPCQFARIQTSDLFYLSVCVYALRSARLLKSALNEMQLYFEK